MSINFNDVGRIGKDAVQRFTGKGEPVTGFSIAIDSGYGDNKQTLWLDCSAWGKRWEGVTPYLVKGAQVSVQGELGTREHEGKTYITLRIADLKLVGGKGEKQASAPSEKRQSAPAGNDVPPSDPDGDIPFRQFRHHSYF